LQVERLEEELHRQHERYRKAEADYSNMLQVSLKRLLTVFLPSRLDLKILSRMWFNHTLQIIM
jgi:hypothetical protein